MNRLLSHVLIGIFTFTVGLVAAKLLVMQRNSIPQPAQVEIQNNAKPQLASQTLTFEDTGISDMFLDYYSSSDGASVGKPFRYGCFEQGSEPKALEEVREERFGPGIIEYTNVLNDKGVKVGERIVRASGDKTYKAVSILWSEGTRIFTLEAPSLNYALAFEKSKAWAAQPCSDFHSLR